MKKSASKASVREKKIRLELSQPHANEVFVAGTFNNWQAHQNPLTRLGNGKWAIDLALAPGRYEYRFVVNGEWINDPQAKETAPNDFGTQNAVLLVNPQ